MGKIIGAVTVETVGFFDPDGCGGGLESDTRGQAGAVVGDLEMAVVELGFVGFENEEWVAGGMEVCACNCGVGSHTVEVGTNLVFAADFEQDGFCDVQFATGDQVVCGHGVELVFKLGVCGRCRQRNEQQGADDEEDGSGDSVFHGDAPFEISGCWWLRG